MSSSLEQRVLDAVDLDEIVADLAELVAIPSVGGSRAEAEVQTWCADRLRSLDFEVDHWRVNLAELTAQPGFPGQEVERDEASGCVGVLGGTSSDPALVFCGHTDVVPPGDLDRWPDRDPYTVRADGDVLAGRGTCDMKGGLAAVFGAVSALRRAGVRPARPLAVHTVVGEEDGGLGAFATLRRGHRGQACVLAEPSSGTIVAANGGSLTFRLEVTGHSTHGSTRTRGVNAVEKLAELLPALRDLEARRNANPDPLLAHLDVPYPLSVGSVRAGDWASTVPDLAVAEGRYGVRLDEDLDTARKEFTDAVEHACARDTWLRENPVRVTWPGGTFASGRLPAGHDLLNSTVGAVQDAGGPPPPVLGAPYGTDLRLYAAAGVPTLQFGPGDIEYAHSHDEHVTRGELEHTARTYALLALRRCGAA
ncbi:ArgE/DapE family deacylase [Allosaccharopolyspora coralli]|uniref:ArgE/DapE family deacylase n=1 Tax=Allosaccharopolyspora coralli TaxID=2665642 RepID=A0A5Q3QKR0_9PSEU|nr:ArgE/DapE family deacylase [Allosaccharopolyspora coralli]QGK71427.1 ArgE/DapE family deacylase [Allosaccharopolyspora coralli]